jgi:hypothetical protein
LAARSLCKSATVSATDRGLVLVTAPARSGTPSGGEAASVGAGVVLPEQLGRLLREKRHPDADRDLRGAVGPALRALNDPGAVGTTADPGLMRAVHVFPPPRSAGASP